MLELLGLAFLELAAVAVLALPARLDPKHPWWRVHLERVRPKWIASIWRLITLPRVRWTVGLALVAAAIGWIFIRFDDDLPIAMGMALEVGGITLLGIEVFIGHEAERYDAVMAEAHEVATLYNVDNAAFVMRSLPLLPAAMEQVGGDMRIGGDREAHADAAEPPAKSPESVTPAQAAMLNLVMVVTTAGFAAGNPKAILGDVDSAAKIVNQWLGDLINAANKWHDGRRDSIFGTRRLRLFLGVLALAGAAAVHAWHLQELHHLL